MSLSVPPVASYVTRAFVSYGYHQPAVSAAVPNPQQIGLDVKFDLNRQELIFEEGQICPVQFGNWIVVSTAGRFLTAKSKLPLILKLT
jgi:ubiquitin-conjugating enzyme E2 Q